MGVKPEDVLRRARADLGYKESPRGSNKTSYGAWYGLNYQPWCAMAVSKWFHEAGMPLKIETSKGFAWTVAGLRWFKARGRWYTRGPRPGDLVFFNFAGGSNICDHVGIVERVGRDGLHTIEGNTGTASNNNGGQVMRRVRGAGVVGFGRPNWGGAAAPRAPAPAGDGYSHPVLKRGAKGRSVWHLQDRLLRKGTNIVRDSAYGAHTEAAVKRFQRARGLTADGVVGSKTWFALHH